MSEHDDEQLDATLGEFFRVSLHGQDGRSESFFRQHLKAESRLAWRTRSFLIAAFGAGLAASVAVLWATPIFHNQPPADQRVVKINEGPRVDPALFHPVVERTVDSHTSDEGVIMLDEDTAVRVYRRQAIERTRYFDEHDAVQSQEVTPRDDLVLMKLTTY
ncbi:MAG TPA: hypothetical protein VIM11_13900 [Tepidisphaeraceae bacterium]|jgi:hypothetical protein